MVHWSFRNLFAAAPLFALAATYAATLASDPATFRDLARILRIEILVIHSLPFIVWVALVRPETGWGRLLQWSVLGGLFCLYLAAARATGWEGVVLFLALSVGTYLGFFLNMHDEGTQTMLSLRWLVMSVLFILLGAVTGLPERLGSWDRSSSTLYMGMSYFGIIGSLEAIGFYQALVGNSNNDRPS